MILVLKGYFTQKKGNMPQWACAGFCPPPDSDEAADGLVDQLVDRWSSRRRRYCPSVFALMQLMCEVQLDITINHDLREREVTVRGSGLDRRGSGQSSSSGAPPAGVAKLS